MLSPNENEVKGYLGDALGQVLSLNNYARTSQSLTIGKLPTDPQWLIGVRQDVSSLRKAGNSWMLEVPENWASVLATFVAYASSVQGVVTTSQSSKLSSTQWRELLDTVLKPQLKDNLTQTLDAQTSFQSGIERFKALQPRINDDIDAGWASLAEEEKEMVQIATRLGSLQDEVNNLSTKIDSNIISTGKSVTSSTVTMLYKVATGVSQSFSFVTMATTAFSVGKSFYDLIQDSNKIAEDLRQIAELQTQISEEAQAAAGTKIVIQLLYQMEIEFAGIGKIIPQIIQMWEAEQDKLNSVIEALEAGVNPNTYFELQTLPTAAKIWNELATYTQTLSGFNTEPGRPITLDPLASAQQVQGI